MRNTLHLFAFASLLSCTTLYAQEDVAAGEKVKSTSFDGYEKFRFGGYGEMAASYMDYDFNRFASQKGSTKRNRGTVSIPRFILAFDYKFSPKW